MITNRPVCGKAFEVLWPNLWRFKRENVYLCSWGCMRALDDKKGLNRDMKLSEEQRKTAIDMALNGESPVKYIAGCGINNPSCTWWNLKKYLQKNDPETYGRLPEKFKATVKNVKQVETPEGEFAKAPVLKVDGAVRIETPEKNKVEVVETPEGPVKGPVTPDELYEKFTSFHTVKNVSAVEADMPERFCRYTAIDTPIGEFHYDRRHGYMDWDWDNNTMSLNTEEWKEFMKWFPYALERLGVKL